MKESGKRRWKNLKLMLTGWLLTKKEEQTWQPNKRTRQAAQIACLPTAAAAAAAAAAEN
jgi:hypothetical protein